LHPGTDYPGSYTDPKQWRSFDDVVAWSECDGHKGIGFVFTADDDIVGVDLDNCYSEEGELLDWGREILSVFRGAYVERTPSGRGVHIIGRSPAFVGKTRVDLPGGAGVERYSRSRYFTFTGDVITDGDVIDITSGMAWLADRYFPGGKVEAPRPASADARRDQLDYELARVCLEHLAGSRASNGDDWRTVGYACKGISEQLKEDWIRWSSSWPQCDRAECEDRWSRFDSRSGVGTLVYLAALDSGLSPVELRDLAKQRLGVAVWENAPGSGGVSASKAPGTTRTKARRRRMAVPDIPSTGAATLTDISTLTDTGLARRLVLEAKGSLRYVREWKSWLSWDGRRWIHDEAGLAPQHIAKKVGDALWHDLAQLPHERRESALPFVKAAASSRAIDAAVKLARSEPEVIVSARELDQHDYLLNVLNGTLDLKSAKILPHSQDNLITHLAEVQFDETATCPRWRQFIDEVTDGDQELAAFLQRSCGLALSGDVTEQSLWLHYGEGRNGKSTLLIILSDILGSYAGPAPFDMLLAKENRSREAENQFATLAGLRLATAIEADGGSRFSEATVKILTGGDPVQARQRYGHPWKLRPTWKLHLAVNDKPVVRGTDEGIWRRLKLTPWLRRFEGRNDNRNLKDELREERNGILNWCLTGFTDWRENGGLRPPESVLAATQEYRGENDTIGLWIAECCLQDPNAAGVAMALFSSYRTWCEARGERPTTQTAFGRALHRLGFEKERPTFGPYRFKTIRRGIGLIADHIAEEVTV